MEKYDISNSNTIPVLPVGIVENYKPSITIEERTKSFEEPYKIKLSHGTPKIIRLDMRSANYFTKNLIKPFDEFFSHCMVETTKHLCDQIPGAKFGYTQSDEITIVIKDTDENGNHIDFYDNTLIKISTLAASLCTNIFNKEWVRGIGIMDDKGLSRKEMEPYIERTFSANFDCKYFDVPSEDELLNNLYLRQKHCLTDSIDAVSRLHFTLNELKNIDSEGKIKMLSEKGINFYDVSSKYKNGLICYKVPTSKSNDTKYIWKETVAPTFKSNIRFISSIYNGTGLFEIK